MTRQERMKYDERAREIVRKMTFEEKVHLMSGSLTPQKMLEDFSTPGYHYNMVPYPAGGNERQGVPSLRFCDGPRGVVCGNSTCFPVTMGRGATFDTDLEERVGKAIGREIRAHGGNFYGGVCINLPYNPGWGRSQEVYGEDSFHLGEMGRALVRGVQSQNVLACIKHYAFNSMEISRFKVSVTCDKRTEQEVFLPHFKACIDEGAASVMTAYNLYNQVHCGHSEYLLEKVLREDWRFDGIVISDFVWGIKDTVAAANGGMNVEMPCTMLFGDRLVKAVRDGFVPEEKINKAAVCIIRTLLAFEEAPDPEGYPESVICCEEHIKLALECARKSITLMKNESVLPFDSSVKKVAVIGRLADKENIGDHGSSRVFPPYVVTIPQALRKRGLEVVVCDGSDAEKARKAAAFADAVLIVAGYDHDDEGEYVAPEQTSDMGGTTLDSIGGDRECLGLKVEEAALINTIGRVNPKTAVVLIGGNTIITSNFDHNVPAMLMAYYPGMEGGTAIAEIVFGDVNPSGKLPFVVPYSADDLPYVNWNTDQQHYEYYHGYARLDKRGIRPEYPYGFGLSYTTFSVSSPAVSIGNDGISVSCRVKNTGRVSGDEVVQLYIGFENSKIDRPKKLLRGFRRVSLDPGEEKEIAILCPFEKLMYYDPVYAVWRLEDIVYRAYIGTSSDMKDLLALDFRLNQA
ncbi:MAG: glycosyl hydrolase [Clostridiaceae bacterium]|jgi:beta-glucosidase|nr:glycosyl hydrolase [Clostridiaceae bacterium]